MRINKRVFPALEEIQKELGCKVYYVSQHFLDECQRNESKFVEGADSMLGLYETQCYEKIKGQKFIYIGNAGVILYGVHGSYCGYANKEGRLVRVVKEKDGAWRVYYDHPGAKVQMSFVTEFMMKMVRVIGLFKEFAELEEKTLPPNGKVKEFHCRYKSDFNFPIGLLSENWYTASCQTHPFVVRGHWRWQPCGEKSADRKLIWIDPFMKQGYRKGPYMADESKNP